MSAPWNFAGVLALALSVNVVSLPAADAPKPTTVPANPTFAKDVLPIFQRSCQVCHRPDQMAPFSLLTYDDARPWARSIKQKVETRYMPRARYWDAFAAQPGVQALHYEDVPEWRALVLPDRSHVTREDRSVLTAGLAAELRRRGWLR